MIKFTKEEVNLCKQVAKKHRKRIDDGDWYLRYDYDEPDVYLEGMDDDKAVAKSIPLWAISDCLEFLREQEWHIVALTDDAVFDEIFHYHCEITDYKFDKHHSSSGKTPLEAYLKAVLAVLEEE